MRRNTWTEEECERLRAHIASGGSAARASVIFKRPITSLQTQARKLGTPFPDSRVVRKQRLIRCAEAEREAQRRECRTSAAAAMSLIDTASAETAIATRRIGSFREEAWALDMSLPRWWCPSSGEPRYPLPYLLSLTTRLPKIRVAASAGLLLCKYMLARQSYWNEAAFLTFEVRAENWKEWLMRSYLAIASAAAIALAASHAAFAQSRAPLATGSAAGNNANSMGGSNSAAGGSQAGDKLNAIEGRTQGGNGSGASASSSGSGGGSTSGAAGGGSTSGAAGGSSSAGGASGAGAGR
jgi:hypothetical protein